MFLSVWLMTGCACVSYTDKRKEAKGEEKIEKTVIDVLQVDWLHRPRVHRSSITETEVQRDIGR